MLLLCCVIFFILILFTLLLFHSVCPDSVLRDAAAATISTQQKEACANNQTTKDDIVRLMHLFKEPMAQRHWSNLFGVLKRAELDARKSNGQHSEAANPLDSLAEIYND